MSFFSTFVTDTEKYKNQFVSIGVRMNADSVLLLLLWIGLQIGLFFKLEHSNKDLAAHAIFAVLVLQTEPQTETTWF